MSQAATVDGLRLDMPGGWWVWKYDDSAFHRNQFQNFAGGSKAVDAVALAVDDTLWLIEIKDYRRHRRSKPASVFVEKSGPRWLVWRQHERGQVIRMSRTGRRRP